AAYVRAQYIDDALRFRAPISHTAAVTRRRFGRLTALGVVLLAGCLALSGWLAVRVRDAAATRSVSSVLIEPRQALAHAGPARPGRPMVSVATPLSDCEARIERQPRQLPTVAIVGAS